MADTGAGSPADNTPSGEQNTGGGAGITPEAQAIIDKLTKEREAANKEAAAYRIKEKERAEKEQAEQGKYAELTATLQKERDQLAAEKAALELANTEKAAKLEAIEKARKTELLSKLPAEKRAAYVDFDLIVLEQITKDFSAGVPSGNSQGNERGAGGGANPTLDGMTQAQLFELLQSNPAAYNKLMQGK